MFEFENKIVEPIFDGCRPPHPHGGLFPPEKPRYTMTEEVEHTARQMRETIDRLLRFEERLKSDVNDITVKITNDNVIFKSTMRDGWVSFIEEVKREINTFESNVDATITLFQTDVESNYSGLSEEVNTNVAECLKEVNEKIDEMESKYASVKTDIQEQYNSFVENVNSRIDNNNGTFEQSFADYQQKLTTELNMFEAGINNALDVHRESMNETFETFKTTWTQIVEERLNNQDAKLDDADMYMRTNLTATVTTLIGDMKDNGEFDEIISGEVFNHLEEKIETASPYVSIKEHNATGDGESDDTLSFKNAIVEAKENKASLFIPKGDYVIKDTLDCVGLDVIGENGATLYFDNEALNGLVVGAGKVENITLFMQNGFSGNLLSVMEGSENYPDTTIIENVRLYSLNEENVGTFCYVSPSSNYGGIFEKITIGRMVDGVQVTNKAENGLFVDVSEWATGYTFRDIVIDGRILNPLKVVSPDYLKCMKFLFDNVQVQHHAEYEHNYLARFEGCQDLYIENCKLWDVATDDKNVIYKDCTNVVVRNSPAFDKYFCEVNPFKIEGTVKGYKENLKLYNSGISTDGGFIGHCETITIDGEKTSAVPYLFPLDYEEMLYSKALIEVWTRLNYEKLSGDNYTRFELMQTTFLNNMLYMNAVKSYATIKKVKKYKEGLVVWFKGGIDVNVNYITTGKLKNVSGKNLTTWEGTTELVSSESWDDASVIPTSKNLTIFNGLEITHETSV